MNVRGFLLDSIRGTRALLVLAALAATSVASCTLDWTPLEPTNDVTDVAPADVPIDDANDSGCVAPTALCGSGCVDLQTSQSNCGSCNVRCSGGQHCVSGSCQ